MQFPKIIYIYFTITTYRHTWQAFYC